MHGPSSKMTSILTQTVHDIPAWARAALVMVALCGVVVIVVASLMGRQEQTIAVDKLLHFSGYATIAMIFVLGLRPSFYLPALVLLAIMSITVEYLQPLNARNFDARDMVSNLIGLSVGFALGLVLRLAGRVMSSSIKQHQLARHRRSYSPGAMILQQGAPVQKFFVIEKGQVQLSREADGQRQVLGTMGPGEMFGLLGVLQAQSQYSTVEAVQATTVLCLDMEDLAGDIPEQLRLVMHAMAKQVQKLADRVVEAEQVV